MKQEQVINKYFSGIKLKISREHQDFLELVDIKLERVKALNLDPQILVDIASDYEKSQEDLLDSAEYIAKKIQRCKYVHSVRWRIKDTSHLIEKIIRKKEEQSEKYADITTSNYKSKIDDLIGVRAIYLFKQDWSAVHSYILSKWTPLEDVKIYHRKGDDLDQYEVHPSCKPEEHKAGYRSIHYIIPAGEIYSEKISCEIQTRTIFEEGWSEIDHKVRYPNFSKDPNLKEFLDTFNRLAGSADEMGTFVLRLKHLIESENQAREHMQNDQAKISALENKIDNLLHKIKDHEELKQAFNELKHTSKTLNNEIMINRVINDPRERRRLARLTMLNTLK